MTDVLDGQTEDSITMACPECGTVSTVHADRRLASDFCPSCDYPLFWARPSSVAAPADDRSDDSLRRAPGASGSALTSTLGCPACGELNVPSATHCVRCGSDMNPPPPPPPPVPPAPEPPVHLEPAPLPEPCGHPRTWVVVLLTAVATVTLTLLVVWLV